LVNDVAARLPPIGVLGGTFDPVHLGHLQIAERLAHVMDFERMLLLPTASPPHKSARDIAAAADREAMVRLALRDRPRLELSTLELTGDRVCYTYETMLKLRRGPPPCRPFFCLGMDALIQIHTWRNWQELLHEFDLVVVDRWDRNPSDAGLDPGIAERLVWVADQPGAGRAASDDPTATGGRVFHVRLPTIEIASSAIRARAARGASIDGLVPPAVAEYIHRTRIYRQERTR
jgi:nicotinate-nucleotide adenylyltransferase